MKSLGLYYWYVKMSRCGCVEHGLKTIKNYIVYFRSFAKRAFKLPMVNQNEYVIRKSGQNDIAKDKLIPC